MEVNCLLCWSMSGLWPRGFRLPLPDLPPTRHIPLVRLRGPLGSRTRGGGGSELRSEASFLSNFGCWPDHPSGQPQKTGSLENKSSKERKKWVLPGPSRDQETWWSHRKMFRWVKDKGEDEMMKSHVERWGSKIKKDYKNPREGN